MNIEKLTRDGRASPKHQEQVTQLLETLAALGKASVESGRRFTAVSGWVQSDDCTAVKIPLSLLPFLPD